MRTLKKIIGLFLISIPFLALLAFSYIKFGIEGIYAFLVACGIAIVIALLVGAGIYLMD